MIPGLIDSGADSSVLPAGYAPLLGYGRTDLDRVEGSQVGGSVTLLHATRPSTAYVPEFPDLAFEVAPFFVHGCQHAMWGRADLMHHFDITISERRQEFLLIPADSATAASVLGRLLGQQSAGVAGWWPVDRPPSGCLLAVTRS